MNPFEMVVLIVFFSVVGGIINTAIKTKGGSLRNWKDWDWDLDDLWDDDDDDDDDDGYKKTHKKIARQQQKLYEDKIAGLEERIKVLEAIVTDPKYNLKKEIEKLEA